MQEQGVPDYLYRDEITFNARLTLPTNNLHHRRVLVGFTWHPSVLYSYGSLLDDYGGDGDPRIRDTKRIR